MSWLAQNPESLLATILLMGVIVARFFAPE
jgi:hypothetical protein